MRISFILVALAIAVFSCQPQEKPQICNVDDPLTELVWLKDLLATADASDLSIYSYLIQGSFQEEPVFIPGNCCPFCNWMPVVLDCQGNPIPQATLFEVVDQKVIWRAEGSVCA